MASPAIFLDRDGVLLEEREIIKSIDDVKVFPFVGAAIEKFRLLGFKIFMVSNQTVVARNLLSFEAMLELNQQILEIIKKQNSNALFDGLYFCPHHPKATNPTYRVNCECRKPRPGMVLTASQEHSLDLPKSIIIGDRPTDIYAGKSVGCRGFLVKTGAHQKPLIESDLTLNATWLKEDNIFDTLLDTAKYLEVNHGS